MDIYALVGKSGTGKSYRASNVAYENDIKYIIDDGLLIEENRVLIGKSAKREHTKISAVKTALFMNENHNMSVRNKLSEVNPDKILILGTSTRMIYRICEALDIGNPKTFVFIEDVASEEEINEALESRYKQGKHVIPVPTFEIKRDFSGYFLDKLKIFRRKDKSNEFVEKSVVRPTYSYMGNYIIYDKVITQIIRYNLSSLQGIDKINRVRVITKSNGIIIGIDLNLNYGVIIPKQAEVITKMIKEEVDKICSINVLATNVYIRKLIVWKFKK